MLFRSTEIISTASSRKTAYNKSQTKTNTEPSPYNTIFDERNTEIAIEKRPIKVSQHNSSKLLDLLEKKVTNSKQNKKLEIDDIILDGVNNDNTIKVFIGAEKDGEFSISESLSKLSIEENSNRNESQAKYGICINTLPSFKIPNSLSSKTINNKLSNKKYNPIRLKNECKFDESDIKTKKPKLLHIMRKPEPIFESVNEYDNEKMQNEKIERIKNHILSTRRAISSIKTSSCTLICNGRNIAFEPLTPPCEQSVMTKKSDSNLQIKTSKKVKMIKIKRSAQNVDSNDSKNTFTITKEEAKIGRHFSTDIIHQRNRASNYIMIKPTKVTMPLFSNENLHNTKTLQVIFHVIHRC